MADRNVHYEAAFEAMLRARGTPYVAVDEAKRAIFARSTLKSFDFFVHSRVGPNLLVDVKGRKSATGRAGRVPPQQTWVTRQDVEDLGAWETVFGAEACGVLAFVYWTDPPLFPDVDHFEHAGRWYRMIGVGLEDYRHRMRRRSAKWQTVALPIADFRDVARPMPSWL